MKKASTRKAALTYAQYRWHVFPVARGMKTPLTHNGYKDASIDEATINAWWDEVPDANLGLACAMSGVIALDGDPSKYDDASRALLADLMEEYPTATQITPTGGVHLVYMLPDDVTLSNSAGSLPPGWDVRVNGYILLAPSVVTYRGDDARVKGV